MSGRGVRIGRIGLLFACLAWWGCGSEGGVTGTGISSSVAGNVSQVSNSVSPAGAPLPYAIRVSIDEFPGVETTTDTDGRFALAGGFSGRLTLTFANASSGAAIGSLPLEVPAGSETVLENIEIRTSAPVGERVLPAAVRQFGVFGRVETIECAEDGAGTLLVSDHGRPARQYLVTLTDETVITARDGEPRRCADLQPRAAVQVDGFVRRTDQTLVAAGVVIAAVRPLGPPGPRAERIRGVVRAVACARGVLEVEQRNAGEPLQRIIALTDDTDILCAADAPAPCACDAIRDGSPITVGGLIFPDRPGVVVAQTVIVDVTLRQVDFVALVAATACAEGNVELRDLAAPAIPLRATLTRRTSIVCGRRLCACSDLRPRQRVRVEGARDPNRPMVFVDRLTVLSD